MEKITNKFTILKERIKNTVVKINELKKENQKLRESNDSLLSKMMIYEEEIKMARKYVKERDIIKSRIENILENIDRARI
ncbi:MAG: hypothetical protein A2474_03260 [Elusimicrobia bacterium RIFOXYC2_FULL_34_12]|nr:MAG: hypothetical protein A2474_03260 [Elusimicrobia bacterium RIFOXYC2_FULL_34_12]OGS39702.1 MAG: hypothetical protein A2551_05580 [Elusimicrobia bacterium RIFOXYD2_FULL_34_30]HAM38744.1 hypothetical protein [Elusimicrobiota bacterium]